MKLALDLGKTWLRACLSGADRRSVRSCRLPAVPWRQLPAALPALRRRLGFQDLERLSVGACGVWSTADRAAARRLLRGWARKVTVFSDVELAHDEALGGEPGVLVVGGTGSIALARDRRGRTRRAGGWGPLLGDEGSAFWVGRSALHDPALTRRLRLDPLRLAHSAQPVRAVAALAPRVLALARRDQRARLIRDQAAGHLADLAAQAARGLCLGRTVRVAPWGGLFKDAGMRRAFRQALRRRGLTGSAIGGRI